MSSNPFRRSRVPVEPDAASTDIFHGARAPADEAAASTPPIKTKTKRVVIQSPPRSPEEVYGVENGARPSSPMIPAGSATSLHGRAGGNVGDSERESDRECDVKEEEGERAESYGHRPTSGSGSGTGRLPPKHAREGAMRAPSNPFARTLATPQAESGTWNDASGIHEHEQKVKPALDVDAFKDILLRGLPVPAGLSTTAESTPSQDIQENSRETSSPSGSPHGLRPGSPEDAHHDYETGSEEDDNERSGLMGVDRSDDLAPPAPPKTKGKGPQTVSFADFDQSIPPGFMAPGPRPSPVSSQRVTGILRSASPRPGSDFDKPLPPPPQDNITTAAPPSVPETNTPALQRDATESPSAAATKLIPPPPPTRKSGGANGRARSSSNLSNMTQDSATASAADTVAPVLSNKLAPPPPPTRKSIPIPQPAQSPAQQEIKHTPAPPPPPLRRHSSKSGRSSSNTSRQPSDDSTAAPKPVSVTPSSVAVPPPPPPRRPHGSKRTSLDGPPTSFSRRLSGEHYRATSFDSERSASISSLQKVAETSESTEHALASHGPDQSRDILAEMSAFQAELDALAQASKDK